MLRGPLAALLEELGHHVDGDDLAYERAEREGERAGPRPGVERPLVARERHEAANALAERVGPILRELPEPLGGDGEAPADSVRFGHVLHPPCGPVRPASSPM